jgi:hypothetical protein
MKTGKGRSRFFDPSPPQEKQRSAVNNWNSRDDKTFPKGGMNIEKEPSFPARAFTKIPLASAMIRASVNDANSHSAVTAFYHLLQR